jgi:LmbE family N-acetylglucosaminyl deacetylase
MMLPESALENAIVVVAHPDDEILWFSSVLDRASAIVVCFTDAGHSPEIGAARQKSLDEHEYAGKITNLDLEQVKSHNQSAWPEPEETAYGLRLTRSPECDGPFVEQARRVESALDPIIEGAANVYTHNPWGEYGHEDHVQVCRIATALAQKYGANTWYSGYVSNKSVSLMGRYAGGYDHHYYSMPVDTERARSIADTYYRNDAWTFIDGYRWFDTECFINGPLSAKPSPGWLVPVNFIRVPFDAHRKPNRPGLARRMIRRLRKTAFGNDGGSENARSR